MYHMTRSKVAQNETGSQVRDTVAMDSGLLLVLLFLSLLGNY